MRKFSVVIIALVAIFAISCSGKKVKMQNELTSIEQKVKETSDAQQKENFKVKYAEVAMKFADAFPQDTNGAAYLLKASEYQYEMMKMDDAQKTLLKIYDLYPSYSKRAEVMLNIAISFDQQGNIEKAKTFYSDFLKAYPNDRNAQVAKDAVSLLGKNLDELAAEFEKKLQQGGDSLKK